MENVTFEIKGNIAVVTLNRSEAFNAFNFTTLSDLHELVDQIRTNSHICVVIFTGSGEKAFSVGADLKERKTLTEEEVKRNIYKIGEVFNSIDLLPQPTIAAINGFAFGGGMELALACDFRIASSEAVMGLTETSLAIIPGAGGTQRLPRLIGQAKALELILTAKRIKAEEALSYGLVNEVSEKDKLLETSFSFAEKMLANGPLALIQAKFAIKQGMNTDLQTGLAIEHKAYELLIPTEDRVEALVAFTEKRKPNFKAK
ncbi:enoyl-CoA hydratase/isomerase family protein [Bacillus sp. V3B]|uniref:enoyl-CoA hydratase-related protein n=1 Tax=Bacillus sp. V3B TaxID=2804915 RepID=UPI0021091690|nr:enoyl-CoA hydratase-related protein [Bacillus sp. V3B]MCQ6274381.1 enoyl-CoA hydratase/isomerase family protein [Bacillus sp. V3B]